MGNTSVDVASLYAALDAARTSKGLSWRQLAREVGVSPSTLSRLANGLNPDVNAFASLVHWLNMSAETFIQNRSTARSTDETQPELAAELAPLLRARSDLTPDDVEYLEELITSAVRRFKSERTGGGR